MSFIVRYPFNITFVISGQWQGDIAMMHTKISLQRGYGHTALWFYNGCTPAWH